MTSPAALPLELGGDDDIFRPFDPAALFSRVKGVFFRRLIVRAP